MNYITALKLQSDLRFDHYHGIKLKGSAVLNCSLTFESHSEHVVTFDNADALLDFVHNERVEKKRERAARRLERLSI